MLLNDAGQFGHGGHIVCGRGTESAMDADTARRLNALAGQLAEAGRSMMGGVIKDFSQTATS